jgi:hypothetical protein
MWKQGKGTSLFTDQCACPEFLAGFLLVIPAKAGIQNAFRASKKSFFNR